jgi:hypothetical protein
MKPKGINKRAKGQLYMREKNLEFSTHDAFQE